MENINDQRIIEELKRRFDEKDDALKALKVVNDKLERLNETLLDSEKVKSQFLSNIRNEINNPLTSIIGLSGQLATSSFDDVEVSRKLSQMIHTEVLNLDYQIRNIFAAAELESGEIAVDCSNTNIGSIIEDVIESLQPTIDEKKINVSVHGTEMEPVFLDAEKLHLMIYNIVGNAVEFNNPDGKVDITVSCESDHFNCEVKDTGIGIASEDKDKIFDSFKQLNAGMRRTHGGHGLGLSVVKALVDFLQGEIQVDSKPGEGTAVKFSLQVEQDHGETVGSSLFGNEFLFDDDDEQERTF